MHQSKNRIGQFGAALGAVLLSSACGGIDTTDPADTARAQSDELRPGYRHHPSPGTGGAPSGTGGTSSGSGGTTGATGGTTSTGGTTTVDCSLCTIAEDCCNAVDAGALCTFSADTCSSLDPGRQASYALYCLTVLRTTISAWTTNGRTPPAACTLP